MPLLPLSQSGVKVRHERGSPHSQLPKDHTASARLGPLGPLQFAPAGREERGCRASWCTPEGSRTPHHCNICRLGQDCWGSSFPWVPGPRGCEMSAATSLPATGKEQGRGPLVA